MLVATQTLAKSHEHAVWCREVCGTAHHSSHGLSCVVAGAFDRDSVPCLLELLLTAPTTARACDGECMRSPAVGATPRRTPRVWLLCMHDADAELVGMLHMLYSSWEAALGACSCWQTALTMRGEGGRSLIRHRGGFRASRGRGRVPSSLDQGMDKSSGAWQQLGGDLGLGEGQS